MTARQAARIWRLARNRHYNATCRFLEVGPLGGEHVVEIEPHPSLSTLDFESLLAICVENGLELSYGKSTRRVLVLS